MNGAGAQKGVERPTSAAEASRSRSSDQRRHFAIYCDESGVHGTRLMGFGSLWMVWERRGDFQQLWRDLQTAHFAPSEAKWTKITKQTLPFFLALVDEFFARNWLMFHCLVLSKSEIDLDHHEGDWDLARRKHFTLLLANKIKRFATPGKVYRVRVDPIHSRYQKADEAAEVILRNLMGQAPRLSGQQVIHSLRTVESKESLGVQMGDVLLGAVMAARHGDVTAGPKLAVIDRIAGHLGWHDLRSDTFPAATKFKVWRFWDPTSGAPRPEITRRPTRPR
jgi:hypothetical protein